MPRSINMIKPNQLIYAKNYNDHETEHLNNPIPFEVVLLIVYMC